MADPDILNRFSEERFPECFREYATKTGWFKSIPATKIHTRGLNDGPRVRDHLGTIKKLPSKLAHIFTTATVIPITNRPHGSGITPRDSKTPEHESRY